MAYTTIDNPTDYFNTKLWTGNATDDTAITGVGFSPDWVWIKNRSTTDSHHTADSVIGAGYRLRTDTSGALGTQADGVKSFDSDGITIGTTGSLNGSGNNIVGWFWRGSDSSAVSNTDGSITSTVSANTTAGFSIVKYAGTGSNLTAGHGLGSVVKMFFVKELDNANSWEVFHASEGASKNAQLNTTAAFESQGSNRWNSTAPTSTTISIGTDSGVNRSSSNYIAYCFAEIKGYSKFGSYTGNGNANGKFVHTGFKPAFFMVKRTNSSGNPWLINDNKRDTFNFCRKNLSANASDAEVDVTSESGTWDLLSNGVKMRNSGTSLNGNGDTYIYMAFAENPFVTAGTKAAGTAR